jgi:peptidoglycan hydrolase CwlO-like protein
MNKAELDKVETDLVDKIKRLLPLIRWVIAGAIGITTWVVTIQLSVLQHSTDIEEHEEKIRTLEVNESGIFSTLKSMDKKLDQIDSKLDK